jgi:hypothetical protein
MKTLSKSGGLSARRARLGTYLATGVGAIGIGTSSEAAVVSIDLSGLTGDNLGIGNGGQSYWSDFPDGPGSNLFGFNNYAGTFTGMRIGDFGPNSNIGIAVTENSNFGEPVRFGAGATIGASMLPGQPDQQLFRNFFRTVADFGPNSFVGFKDGSGRFGYLEVLWTASTDTFKLISGAYESTPGVAIQTPGGSGGAVPEPASGAVVALLMGGTALRQWRKKRRDQETACDESLAS